MSRPDDIAAFLAIPYDEAKSLWVPRRKGVHISVFKCKGKPFLLDAIAHLDEIAVRHGLTVPTDEVEVPQPSAERERAFLATLRHELQLEERLQ